MSKFTEMMKNRRSIYALGENLPISKEEVTALVKEVVRESPTAFNSTEEIRKDEHIMSKFTEMMKNRRSIYALGENLPISKEEVTALVKEVVRESPTAFNSQTQRVVFLFGDAHKKLWAMTEDALKPLTP
ncbi:hypothetical protein RDI61_28985, partial [Pseudomonas plecoglossicida]|nr:hypothetical protein [Pseudomonas plecoglossicida]